MWLVASEEINSFNTAWWELLQHQETCQITFRWHPTTGWRPDKAREEKTKLPGLFEKKSGFYVLWERHSLVTFWKQIYVPFWQINFLIKTTKHINSVQIRDLCFIMLRLWKIDFLKLELTAWNDHIHVKLSLTRYMYISNWLTWLFDEFNIFKRNPTWKNVYHFYS